MSYFNKLQNLDSLQTISKSIKQWYYYKYMLVKMLVRIKEKV